MMAFWESTETYVLCTWTYVSCTWTYVLCTWTYVSCTWTRCASPPITIPSRKHWWLHPRQVSSSLALLLPSRSPPPARTYWGGAKIILSDLLEALLQPGTWRTSRCTTWECSPPTDWETPTSPKSSTSTSRQLVSRNLTAKKSVTRPFFAAAVTDFASPRFLQTETKKEQVSAAPTSDKDSSFVALLLLLLLLMRNWAGNQREFLTIWRKFLKFQRFLRANEVIMDQGKQSNSDFYSKRDTRRICVRWRLEGVLNK